MTSGLTCPSAIEMTFTDPSNTQVIFECELVLAHRGLHACPGRTKEGLEYTVTWAADVHDRVQRNKELRELHAYAEAEPDVL